MKNNLKVEIVDFGDLKDKVTYIVCKDIVLINSNLPGAKQQELISNFQSSEKECC